MPFDVRHKRESLCQGAFVIVVILCKYVEETVSLSNVGASPRSRREALFIPYLSRLRGRRCRNAFNSFCRGSIRSDHGIVGILLRWFGGLLWAISSERDEKLLTQRLLLSGPRRWLRQGHANRDVPRGRIVLHFKF